MANEAMRDNWTNWADGWVAHRELFDFELAGFAAALLDRVQPGAGDRVLDVGCGTGVLLEATVAAGGAAVGVDISPAMVDAARERVPAATVLLGDAQTDDLTQWGLFSAVVSRFGVMFFDDPVAAFSNIRSATQSDGRMVFACWRGLEENPPIPNACARSSMRPDGRASPSSRSTWSATTPCTAVTASRSGS
jgi:SAM-dependent methyltransferase